MKVSIHLPQITLTRKKLIPRRVLRLWILFWIITLSSRRIHASDDLPFNRWVELRKDRLAKASADSYMGATDLADFLVTKGVPFRVSHEIVARAVRAAIERGIELDEVKLAEFSPLFESLPEDYLRADRIVARKSNSAVLRD